jgi:hypothetical protein
VRALVHVAGWLLLLAGLQLAVAEVQRHFWYDLPCWAAPRPAPRRVVEVRPLRSLVAEPTGMDNQWIEDAGTQNSGRRGCG